MDIIKYSLLSILGLFLIYLTFRIVFYGISRSWFEAKLDVERTLKYAKKESKVRSLGNETTTEEKNGGVSKER